MHTFSSPCFKIGIAKLVFASVLFVSPLHATLVVDWGGDYVSEYTGLNVGTPSSGGGWITYNYSDTTPISPAGPTFYGAFSLIDSSGTGTPAFTSNRFGIAHVVAGDQLRIGATAGTSTLTMRGLIFFKKEDFLGGGATSVVNFSEGGSLSINVGTSSGDTRQVKMAVYALVDGEWNWYLSATTRVTSFSLADPAAENWALYEIDSATAPLNAQPSSSFYNVSGALFEDIGAAGFFFNYQNTAGNNVAFFMNSFQMEATVVPEGRTVSFLMGALSLAVLRAWKKQQN